MARIQHHGFGRIVVRRPEERRDQNYLRIGCAQLAAAGSYCCSRIRTRVLDELPKHLVVDTSVESLCIGEAVRRGSELEPGRTATALHLTC
jgi:hypothetical protein